jgi:hypothetical protein
MKKPLIILSFIIFSLTTYSQDEIEIPKRTNKIILRTELNEKDNFKLILRILKENDFEIKQIDTTTYQIQTSQKKLEKSFSTYTLNFNVFNQLISVTGNKYTEISPVTNDEIKNWGLKNSDPKLIFGKMNKLCLKIVSQDKIEYTTKN